MRWLPFLLGCVLSILHQAPAAALEFWAYKATVNVPLQSAATVAERDVIEKTRLTSKTLVNAALGQPLSRRVPKSLVLVVLVPTSRMAAGSRLAILDRDTGQIRTTIASLADAQVLQSDTGKREAVGVGEAQVQSLPLGGSSGEAQLLTAPFSIIGNAKGRFTDESDTPGLKLKVTGLNARFDRQSAQGQPFYYANAILKGRLRASGRPLATVDL